MLNECRTGKAEAEVGEDAAEINDLFGGIAKGKDLTFG